MANFYIDALTFDLATAVYADIALSTKAPDGFYSVDDTYRQQVGGVLLAGVQTCDDPIIANNDTYSSIVTAGMNGNNILSNDTVNGVPATISNVQIAQVSSTNANVNINTSNGAVVVGTTVPVGTYTIVYRICQLSHITNCATANITVNVTPLTINNCFEYATDCESACYPSTGETTFSYFANKMAGAGDPTPTAGCSAITSIPVYSPEEITEFTTGITIYSNSGLTTSFAGDSKWYGIGANEQGPSYGKFQVNNSGTLVVKQTCPDYCCGEIVLYPSNFTGENANYFINDCDTNAIVGYTVYYGEPPMTVYGRIVCGLNPFNLTRVRATGAESCNDDELTYVLYAQTNALTVGNYLFEDGSGLYTFQHGTVYMKDITTDRVWKVNQYGKIELEYTCV